MEFIFCEEDRFYRDFVNLIAEVECGEHYDCNNKQHVEWLKKRVHSIYLMGGMSLCVYENGNPLGFLLYQHDLGLEGVCCFGKVARIMMFALADESRGKGLGKQLLAKVCQKVKEAGADCIYTDTYALNSGAINFYLNNGFIQVGVHEGENGIDDAGQLYLYKVLES